MQAFFRGEDDGVWNRGEQRGSGRFVDVGVPAGSGREIAGIDIVAVDIERMTLHNGTGEVEMSLLIPSRAAGEIAEGDGGDKEETGRDFAVRAHSEYSDGTPNVIASQSGGFVPSIATN